MSDADLQASEAAVQSLCLCISSAGGCVSPLVSIQTKRVLRGSIDAMPSSEAAVICRSLVAISDIPAGTPLLRVPIQFIITPSLATRIILAHNPLNSSPSPVSRHQLHVSLSLLSPLSPLALITAALAIIRCCSRDHHHCPTCSPHTLYTLVLGAEPAASMLAIDDPAFDLHVLPLLLSTPLAHSLPRARVDLRAHLDEIAKLIQLGADDVLWAFSHAASRAMAIPDCSDPFSSASCPVSSTDDSPSIPFHQPPRTGPLSKRARTPARSIASMVPLADFCNHSYTRSLSHFEFSSGGRGGPDCVSLVCDCDVKRGEEVHICYGPKTTAQLLCFYGFEMGMPLPCDELHVSLVLPLAANAASGASASCGDDCGGSSAAGSCLDFLSKCSLSISNDNSVTCSLWSSLPSHHSDAPVPVPTSAPPATVPSSAATCASPSPPHQSQSLHRIVHSQPCVEIPKVIANCIRVRCNSACEATRDCCLGGQTEADQNIPPCEAPADGVNWLQDLREMVAYEQTQAKTADSSSSCRALVSYPPSDSQPVSWELHSFLKLHGESAVLALRWFKSALETLRGQLYAGKRASAEKNHPAATQAAAYRACMISVVEQQLKFLQGCGASAS